MSGKNKLDCSKMTPFAAISFPQITIVLTICKHIHIQKTCFSIAYNVFVQRQRLQSKKKKEKRNNNSHHNNNNVGSDIELVAVKYHPK